VGAVTGLRRAMLAATVLAVTFQPRSRSPAWIRGEP
jgi:hypothetical protein